MRRHTSNPLFASAMIAAASLGLAATSAQAATITMTVSNNDWNSAMWGSPAAAPTSGNDYVTAHVGSTNSGWVRFSANGASSTFAGDNLEVVAGTRGLLKNINSTSTINGDLTISGGLVDLGPNGAVDAINGTLDVNNLVISGTGSRLGAAEEVGVFTIDGTLTGSGDLSIFSGSKFGATISIAGISGYTGAIDLESNVNGLIVEFGTDYTFSNSFTFLDADSVLSVGSGQTFTFNEGDLIDTVNGAVAAGTYTASDLGLNYTGSGTIIVVPEPGSLALLGLGGLLIAGRRRRDA